MLYVNPAKLMKKVKFSMLTGIGEKIQSSNRKVVGSTPVEEHSANFVPCSFPGRITHHGKMFLRAVPWLSLVICFLKM